MCGRFTLATPAQQVAEHFGLDDVPELSPRYNIAPTQPIAVVRRSADRPTPLLELRRWGLVPAWAKDAAIGSRMINARLETVAEKPAFRTAFRRRRCLVPADGFYEWKPHPKRRKPHYIHLEGHQVFGLAGLFERWKSPEGQVVESCTVLTTAANARLHALHDRMPILLDPAHYEAWLDPEQTDPDSILPLLRSQLSDRLRFHPVDFRVNNPRNDDAACIAPIESAEITAEDF